MGDASTKLETLGVSVADIIERLKVVEDDLVIDADGDGVPDIKQGSTVTIREL